MMRGEIWWADFGVPVLILQNDAFNISKINTIVVLPLSTSLGLSQAPGNVLLDKTLSKLTKDSVVVVSQISTLDKNRLTEKVGKVGKRIMEDVEEGVKLVLNLV